MEPLQLLPPAASVIAGEAVRMNEVAQHNPP